MGQQSDDDSDGTYDRRRRGFLDPLALFSLPAIAPLAFGSPAARPSAASHRRHGSGTHDPVAVPTLAPLVKRKAAGSGDDSGCTPTKSPLPPSASASRCS